MQNFLNKILVSFFAITVMFSAGSYAQDSSFTIKYDTVKIQKTRKISIVTVRTLPKFILHFNASLNTGAMELTSHNGGFNRYDFIIGKNYGARNGFGFNLIGKLPLGKKGDFWLDIVTGYDRFQSDIFAKNTEEGKIYYNSFNGGVGVEYNITPFDKVKYFFGFNPLMSFISGKSEIVNPDNNRVDIQIKSSFRIGYQAFFGLEYAFDKKFGLNMGLRFTHSNLLLKQSEPSVQDESVVPPVNTVGLNDDAVQEPVEYAGWKQFAYFSASVGLSYFFGVKEVKYRLPDK